MSVTPQRGGILSRFRAGVAGCRGVSQECRKSVTKMSQRCRKVSRSVKKVSPICRGVTKRCHMCVAKCRGVSQSVAEVSQKCREVSRKCHKNVAECRKSVERCHKVSPSVNIVSHTLSRSRQHVDTATQSHHAVGFTGRPSRWTGHVFRWWPRACHSSPLARMIANPI